MLEHNSLLLLPWNAAPPGEPATQVRAILNGSGAAVGFVRAPPRPPRWMAWLDGPQLEVCESPDGSLVFALRRGWGWSSTWHVVDADERPVGTLQRRVMLDSDGHFLAAVEPPDLHGASRFLAIDGRTLGEYAVRDDGVHVTFAPEMDGNPFAKMLLLGAALVRAS